MTDGIDISNWQSSGSLSHWLTGGDDFCFIKATEGTTFKDKMFNKWWAELKSMEIMRGAYHFAYGNNPESEAAFFWKTVKDQGFDNGDWLILDIEKKVSSDIAGWCEKFMRKLESLRGSKAGLLIYASTYFARDNLNSDYLHEFPLWVADYTYNQKGQISAETNWPGNYLIHQWTSNPWDHNWSPKTLDELQRIAGGDESSGGNNGENNNSGGNSGSNTPAPKPHYDFPLPRGYYFGPKEWGEESISGWYEIEFQGVKSSDWLNRWAEQLHKRTWPVGLGRKYLTQYGLDGRYGSEWVELIKAFQRDQGLKVDGLIGPNTWKAAFENPVT